MTDPIPRAAAIAVCGWQSEEYHAILAIPAAQVAVKPLEWRRVAPHGLYEAYGLCWTYQIRVGTDGIARWQVGRIGTWREASTVEAAKALAQADYDDRIRSTLIDAPILDRAQIRADALREAAAVVDAYDRQDGGAANAILALIDTPPAVSDDVAALVDAATLVSEWDEWAYQVGGVCPDRLVNCMGKLRAALAKLKGSVK